MQRSYALLSSVVSPALNIFSLHKRYDFRKKILNIKWVFLFSLQIFSEMFHILRRNGRDVIKMYTGLY